jgi:hypothetical protein
MEAAISPWGRDRSRVRCFGVVAIVVGCLAAVALLAGAQPAALAGPAATASATCSDHSNQAEAQRAADTRDADGDGLYCESLPCPCSTSGGEGADPAPTPAPKRRSSCTRPSAVQRISFSRTKYRHIRAHSIAAVRRGWPRVLVLNRPHASARRERLLEDVATKSGHDRDEYPPAVGRGRGRGLERGSNPRGWMADVEYVASHENRSHGARLGLKLRRFCDGTKFRYVFY